MLDSHLKRVLYDNALCSQHAWKDSAFQLLESAKVILQQSADSVPLIKAQLASGKTEFRGEDAKPMRNFNLHRVGFFLTALALENLLKGLWVGLNFEKLIM